MNDGKYILVIGSAHIDILAGYNKDYAKNIDKVGKLKIDVGGTAYNIAVNLRQANYAVSLFTYLKKDSFLTPYIKKSIREHGIIDNYVFLNNGLLESGYVAHLSNGKLDSAVSCINLDKIRFNKSQLFKAIQNSKIIIIDCNLSKHQISLVIEMAYAEKKRLFISAVSDSKIGRAIYANKVNWPYEVIFMNLAEAKKIISDIEGYNTKVQIESLCNYLNSLNILVTRGEKGYVIYTKNGSKLQYSSSSIKTMKSELGAGDAITAAVCSHAITNNPIKWDKCQEIIDKMVLEVLHTEGATPPAKLNN